MKLFDYTIFAEHDQHTACDVQEHHFVAPDFCTAVDLFHQLYPKANIVYPQTLWHTHTEQQMNRSSPNSPQPTVQKTSGQTSRQKKSSTSTDTATPTHQP